MEAPETCEEYLALPAKTAAKFFAKEPAVQVYSSSGAKSMSLADYYFEVCGTADGAETLSNLQYADANDPDCASFEGLDPATQQAWLAAMYEDQSFSLDREVTSEEIVRACTVFGAGNIVGASNLIKSFGDDYVTWETESKLGYREIVALSAHTLLSGEAIQHPKKDEFIAGAGCGFDPTKDAAIPLGASVKNVTPGQPQPLRLRFALVAAQSGSLTTTAYLEANHSSGASCSESAGGIISGAAIGTKYDEPSEAGEAHYPNYFVIVKDYFSPRYPGGAVDELAAYSLHAQASYNEADPVTLLEPAELSLAIAAP
ncbi:hypothetical protein GCM10010471_27030 [Leucobacter komagatae]